jgi:hypothetical protein
MYRPMIIIDEISENHPWVVVMMIVVEPTAEVTIVAMIGIMLLVDHLLPMDEMNVDVISDEKIKSKLGQVGVIFVSNSKSNNVLTSFF